MTQYKIGTKNKIALFIMALALIGLVFMKPIKALFNPKTAASEVLGFSYFLPSLNPDDYIISGSLAFPDYLTFGDQGQFIAANASTAMFGEDYVVTGKTRMKQYDSGHLLRGEYFQIAYKKISGDSRPELLNLSRWVKENKEDYGIYASVDVVSYQGTDHFLFTIANQYDLREGRFEEDIFQVMAVNLETGEIKPAPAGIDLVKERTRHQYFSYIHRSNEVRAFDLPVQLTSLKEFAEETSYRRRIADAFYAFTAYGLNSDSTSHTNLFADYPQLKSFSQEGGLTLYPRGQMVKPDDWFNGLLHWLAPVGQDRLTVHTTFGNNSQADKVAIRSYADFEQALSLAEAEGLRR